MILTDKQQAAAKAAEAMMRELLLPEHPSAMISLHLIRSPGKTHTSWTYIPSSEDQLAGNTADGDTLEEMLAARAVLPSAVAARIAKLEAEIAALKSARRP